MKCAQHIRILLLLGLFATPHGQAQEALPRELALTFDDLPFVDTSHKRASTIQRKMGKLSRSLRSMQIPATGFVNEQRLYRAGRLDKTMQAVLEQWLDSGLGLGNHGYSHRSLHTLPPAELEREIMAGEQITRRLLEQRGEELRYFRPPYLHVGLSPAMRRDTEQILQKLNYRMAPTTINVNDWTFAVAYEKVNHSANGTVKKRLLEAYLAHISEALAYAEKLSHEMFGRPIRHILGLHANTLNADNIESVATLLQQHGYHFISLDQALRDPAYASLDTYSGPRGETWLYHWAQSAGLHPVDEPRIPDFVKRLAGPAAYQN